MICRAGRLCVWHYLMTPGRISHLRHTQYTMSLVSLYQLLSTVALSPCCLHISCSQLLLSVTAVFISVAPNCCSQLPSVPGRVSRVQTELSLISEHGSVFLLETHSCLGGVMMWPTTEVRVDWTGNLTYKSEPSIVLSTPVSPTTPRPLTPKVWQEKNVGIIRKFDRCLCRSQHRV